MRNKSLVNFLQKELVQNMELAYFKFFQNLYQKKNAQTLKVIKNAPPKVDEITSNDNPATQSGITHPGMSEMEAIHPEPKEVTQSRPNPGKLSEGALGPRR